ncbi:hypothetical protein SUSAZ_09195 [Sulfolobus acidocaldarius SUSAZ]|nr:hypothetical protein SUSAZ_09195 [Sulfolobus acidocaldarius SUSAZ]
MEIRDECGCILNRKYASDFLSKRVFKGRNGNKIGEAIVEGRKIQLYYDKKNKLLWYDSTECPLTIITLEVICEEFSKNTNLDYEKAIKALRSVKGFTINSLVERITEKVVRIVEEGIVHS